MSRRDLARRWFVRTHCPAIVYRITPGWLKDKISAWCYL